MGLATAWRGEALAYRPVSHHFRRPGCGTLITMQVQGSADTPLPDRFDEKDWRIRLPLVSQVGFGSATPVCRVRLAAVRTMSRPLPELSIDCEE